MTLRNVIRSFGGCVVLTASAGLFGTAAAAEDVSAPKVIRVALYAEGVTKKGLPQVERCLPAEQQFELKKITAKEIQSGELKNFDVLIHPGGSGSGQAKALGEKGREQVRKFVERGGGMVGICAGAYMASAEYPWALKLLDAQVVDDEHWARGEGEVQLRLRPIGRDALGADAELAAIHYENGPLLGPAANDDIPDFESLAAFESEIRENDAPVGIMKGTTAIARGAFGQGRVVCFSPHPEKTPACTAFLPAAVRWAAGAKNQAQTPQSNSKK